ncbi:hypothetical protein AGLY_008738 [Aphis glycines]|uniref:Uncharacterized protein n=1 Tax=Aphis glycines TaxID=307491 RepID=A0A6G0TJT9_APHGL|nr:hypothetical protein AGLY_008738 [Aphis glycines]
MWQTVIKQRQGYLRCVIILSTLSLTLNFIILLGESSYMYMYLQKQFGWTMEKYLPFTAYTTLLHGSLHRDKSFTTLSTVPVIVVYVFNTKLQIPEMFIVTAVTALGIFEKVGFAYSVYEWQFYAVKIVGSTVYATPTLVRSQLSKCLPSKDIGKILTFISLVESHGLLLYSPLYNMVYVSTIHNFANYIFLFSAILDTLMFGLFG